MSIRTIRSFREKIGNKFESSYEEKDPLQETVSVYVEHITPANIKGSNMIEIIMECLNIKEILKNYLVAIGCDGSNINIGVDIGTNARFCCLICM